MLYLGVKLSATKLGREIFYSRFIPWAVAIACSSPTTSINKASKGTAENSEYTILVSEVVKIVNHLLSTPNDGLNLP